MFQTLANNNAPQQCKGIQYTMYIVALAIVASYISTNNNYR
ncbi:hypothetical protein UAB1_gp257 [Salmonella phage UAB_1]|nr:hypothetical protein UAB1_gp257 [Salmonella phage UAB_1]